MSAVSLEGIQQLFAQFSSLSTFAEVADWGGRAGQAAENLKEAILSIESEVKQKTQLIENVNQKQKEKSTISRLFSGSREKKSIQTDIDALTTQKDRFQTLVDELQSKIDITPNNPEERAILLKELKLEKKELQLKKRELNEKLRGIRTAARQKSAELPGTFTGLIGGSKYRASARRNIRYNKEAALAPHEDAKSTLERELMHLEKDILWVERFR
jgi:hypothetical protein